MLSVILPNMMNWERKCIPIKAKYMILIRMKHYTNLNGQSFQEISGQHTSNMPMPLKTQENKKLFQRWRTQVSHSRKSSAPKCTAIDLYKENHSEIPEHSAPREKHTKFWEEKTGHIGMAVRTQNSLRLLRINIFFQAVEQYLPLKF